MFVRIVKPSNISLLNNFKNIKSNCRKYSHFCDSGVFDYLDKYNYVGNHGIYWTHPQSSFNIRVTDDYDRCSEGNKTNYDNTCWWYFPKRTLSLMKNGFSEQDVMYVMEEVRKWETLQCASNELIEWSVDLARICAPYPDVPLKQKLFAVKQWISTVHTDDVMEKLNSHPKFNAAADEYVSNLREVFNGTLDRTIDMNKFKGQDDILVQSTIRALNMQKEVMKSGKELLRPQVYDYFLQGCHSYLNGVLLERFLFHKCIPNKTKIDVKDGKDVRLASIGIYWVFACMMTDENTAIHLNVENPVVNLASWIAGIENDLVGSYRDKIDFSPMSFYDTEKLGKPEVELAKYSAQRANEAKKTLENILEIIPSGNSKHYEYLAKYVGLVSDYSFVVGLQKANCRYGWIPRLD